MEISTAANNSRYRHNMISIQSMFNSQQKAKKHAGQYGRFWHISSSNFLFDSFTAAMPL
tara:strand:+ start:278 stop:454 length:177 start_codon:yes stop_codon:yes gene_type:complete